MVLDADGLLVGGILIAAGGRLLYIKFQPIEVAFVVLALGVLAWIITMIAPVPSVGVSPLIA